MGRHHSFTETVALSRHRRNYRYSSLAPRQVSNIVFWSLGSHGLTLLIRPPQWASHLSRAHLGLAIRNWGFPDLLACLLHELAHTAWMVSHKKWIGWMVSFMGRSPSYSQGPLLPWPLSWPCVQVAKICVPRKSLEKEIRPKIKWDPSIMRCIIIYISI